MTTLVIIYMLIGFFTAVLVNLIDGGTATNDELAYVMVICILVWPFIYLAAIVYIICTGPMYISNQIVNYNDRLKRNRASSKKR